jgi:multiple sugar transport system substrate-binding protein
MDEQKPLRPPKSNKHDGELLNWLTIQPHTAASSALASWFHEETGAWIRIVSVPYADITERAIQDARDGSGEFDIFQYWYAMLGALVEKNVLRDVTGWWQDNAAEIQPDDFIPVFRDTWCVQDGRRYGIPFDGDMHLLFYNKLLFNKYHLAVPETWDDYLSAARTITEGEQRTGSLDADDSRYGCGIMAADIPLILIGTFLNRLAGFGGYFFEADGSPAVNSPEALAALEHLVRELPYALPDPTKVAFDEMLGPWMAGRVGMVEFWADLGKMTDNPHQSQMAHSWGVAPLPKGPGPKGKVAAPLNAGWSLGVSTRSRNPELAQEFLRFCLRPDIILRIGTIDGGLDPARWSTYELPEYRACVTEELAAAAKTALQSAAVSWPTGASWPELQTILNENLYLAVTRCKSPREALDDTQAAWMRILTQRAESVTGG